MDPVKEMPKLGLFEGFGIELEYMVVAPDDLSVRPIVDELFKRVTGDYSGEFDDDDIAWSNELALHVVELKTNGPSPTLRGVAAAFQRSVRRCAAELAPLGGRLLPTGMHPTMDPLSEARIWTHDYSPIYAAYDRIFDCKGHGWSNLQSCHLNLPFDGDQEFGRLHLAIRAVLPLLPALAASSPYRDGVATGMLDTRLDIYRHNQRKIPEITGRVVPEPVTTHEEYVQEILRPMWQAIRPHDPDGLLQQEFLNSRGAIARFDRDAIEIRVLDVQESPVCDLAISTLVVETLRALTEERWTDLASLKALGTGELAAILLDVVREGERATIAHPGVLAAFGIEAKPTPAGKLWRRLAEQVIPGPAGIDPPVADALDVILKHGPLARRMLQAAGPKPSRETLRDLYDRVATCLVPGDSPVFLP